MVPEMIVAALLSQQVQEPPTPTPDPGETPTPVEAPPRTTDGHRITAPKKTKTVPPEWPRNALRAGLTGSVVLECVLGIDGRVESVKVLRGYRSLAEAATVAVRKWRYTTTELDGKPVPVIMTVTVNFKLQNPPKRDDVLGSLNDSDPEIRWAAVRWLGRYRPIIGKQRSAIEAALRDPSELVRSAAAEALAKLEGK
jgi:TonB family protein